MLTPLADALGAWAPREAAERSTDPVALLAAGWPEIVGENVAGNSHPTRLSGAVLLVTTRSSAWSQQLSLLQPHVIAAIRARVPQAGVEDLRFRVGAVPAARSARGPAPAMRRATGGRIASAPRAAAGSAEDAVARFRASVGTHQRAKRAAGWKECRRCGAFIAPGDAAVCVACANASTQERAAATARLLFEAPWLGFAGTAALVEGLNHREYASIRTSLLGRWWEMLERARKAGKLSRDGRERLVASSYVLLRSKLPPEEILPATVRNVLGDELHDLIYGKETHEETNV